MVSLRIKLAKFVGDILHSRVFRSSGELFRMFVAQLGVSGPAGFLLSLFQSCFRRVASYVATCNTFEK